LPDEVPGPFGVTCLGVPALLADAPDLDALETPEDFSLVGVDLDADAAPAMALAVVGESAPMS